MQDEPCHHDGRDRFEGGKDRGVAASHRFDGAEEEHVGEGRGDQPEGEAQEDLAGVQVRDQEGVAEGDKDEPREKDHVEVQRQEPLPPEEDLHGDHRAGEDQHRGGGEEDPPDVERLQERVVEDKAAAPADEGEREQDDPSRLHP